MRIGIVLQAVSAIVTALGIAFASGWKLTLVIICFIPLMMFSGVMQGRKQSDAGTTKDKGSFTEQGGQVDIRALPRRIIGIVRLACDPSHRTDSYGGVASSRKPFYQSLRRCVQSRVQVCFCLSITFRHTRWVFAGNRCSVCISRLSAALWPIQ